MDDELNAFVNQYRQALQNQYDATNSQLANDRQLVQANIMSQANKVGAMYSNFPARAKIQYDTSTYLPALQNAFSTYATGLDKLRNNVSSYQNQIASLEKAIADLNSGTIISQNSY